MNTRLVNEDFKKLGAKIRKARKEAGLSQKDVSRALKVSDKAVSSYEVGRNQPSFQILKTISDITHKPISYFGNSDTTDATLEEKLATIERELQEIKELLKRKREK